MLLPALLLGLAQNPVVLEGAEAKAAYASWQEAVAAAPVGDFRCLATLTTTITVPVPEALQLEEGAGRTEVVIRGPLSYSAEHGIRFEGTLQADVAGVVTGKADFRMFVVAGKVHAWGKVASVESKLRGLGTEELVGQQGAVRFSLAPVEDFLKSFGAELVDAMALRNPLFDAVSRRPLTELLHPSVLAQSLLNHMEAVRLEQDGDMLGAELRVGEGVVDQILSAYELDEAEKQELRAALVDLYAEDSVRIRAHHGDGFPEELVFVSVVEREPVRAPGPGSPAEPRKARSETKLRLTRLVREPDFPQDYFVAPGNWRPVDLDPYLPAVFESARAQVFGEAAPEEAPPAQD